MIRIIAFQDTPFPNCELSIGKIGSSLKSRSEFQRPELVTSYTNQIFVRLKNLAYYFRTMSKWQNFCIQLLLFTLIQMQLFGGKLMLQTPSFGGRRMFLQCKIDVFTESSATAEVMYGIGTPLRDAKIVVMLI